MKRVFLLAVSILTCGMMAFAGGGREAASADVPAMDLGGREITVMNWWDDPGPLRGTDETLEPVQVRMMVEEQFNVSLIQAQGEYEGYVELLTASVLAGDPVADIIAIESNWFPALNAGGFLQPWTDDADPGSDYWDPITREAMTVDGEVYGLIPGPYYPRAVMYFNKDLFEREGLPDPYDLVLNGEWTWEKMLEIAEMATRDTDGDGAIDQWGLSGMDFANSLVFTNGARDITRQADGSWDFSGDDPAAIEALNFYQDLIHTHRVMVNEAPEGASWDWPGVMFREGKVAMYGYQMWYIDTFPGNMDDEWGLILYPQGPRADEYISYGGGTNGNVIPAGVENPEAVSLIWNQLGPGNASEEDTTTPIYMAKFTDARSMDVLNYLWDNDISTLSFFAAFSDARTLWNEAVGEIASGAKTPAVAVSERVDAIQAAIDDVE